MLRFLDPCRAILSAAGAAGVALLASTPGIAAPARPDPETALTAVSRGTAAVLGVSAVMGAGVGVALCAQHRRAQAKTARPPVRMAAFYQLERDYTPQPLPPVYGGAWEEPAYGDDFTPLPPEPRPRRWREENAGAMSEFGFPPRRGPTRSF
jgi:hypothetical protein